MTRILIASVLVCVALGGPATAQLKPPPAGAGPWFGLKLPAAPGTTPAVRVGARPPRPVALPPGDPVDPALSGASLKADVATIVGFAHKSRERKEIGSGQLWGRISGLPSGADPVNWAADQFRKAGINDVRVQSIAQNPSSSLWLPLSWRVTLLGDPAFGPGSSDVVLESALPIGPSTIAGGAMTAPLVYVGSGNASVQQHIDVKGKVAVELVVPQGHMLFERQAVDTRSGDLIRRGAAGVFNLVRLPGNEQSHDFTDCGNPCFNIGGRDGWFLEQVLDRASQAGVADKLRVRLELQSESRNGLHAANAVAVVPGRRAGEAIVLNAHADGWYDGAGDNADGLAVLIGLARHFSKPGNQPERTIVFVASAGHHTPGINGPRSFLNDNVEFARTAVMLVNIEHVAQRNFSPARTVGADGYREAVADSGEAPIAVGVTNNSPVLQALIDQGPARYGVNFISDRSTFQSGETGGWAMLNVAKVSVMQAPPLYHTTGEVLDVISEPGLERIARFLAFFVRESHKADRAGINP